MNTFIQLKRRIKFITCKILKKISYSLQNIINCGCARPQANNHYAKQVNDLIYLVLRRFSLERLFLKPLYLLQGTLLQSYLGYVSYFSYSLLIKRVSYFILCQQLASIQVLRLHINQDYEFYQLINTMKMHQEKHKQKQVFLDLVKVKKVQLQKDNKSIEKHASNKLRIKINSINPEQNKSTQRITYKVQQQSPRQSSPRSNKNHFQDFNTKFEKEQFQQMREQHILKQKAKNFILKLKKEREQNKGKFLLLRKKQEQRKRSQQKKQQEEAIKYFESYKNEKMHKMLNNIILHQYRIDYRQNKSLQRVQRKSQVRSKTEANNRSQVIGQQQKKQMLELPSIKQPRKRLTNSLYLGQAQDQ